MFKLKTKKRPGIMGVNFTAMGIGIFFSIATIVTILAVSYFATVMRDSKISMAESEVVEIYNAALKYSSYATENGSGFEGITAFNLKPYMSLNMPIGSAAGVEDINSFLCSATSYGCDIKYYITSSTSALSVDNALFHIYVDAEGVFSSTVATEEFNEKRKFELNSYNILRRVSNNQALLNGAATSITAANGTPTESTDTSGQAIPKFEIFNLK